MRIEVRETPTLQNRCQVLGGWEVTRVWFERRAIGRGEEDLERPKILKPGTESIRR